MSSVRGWAGSAGTGRTSRGTDCGGWRALWIRSVMAARVIGRPTGAIRDKPPDARARIVTIGGKSPPKPFTSTTSPADEGTVKLGRGGLGRGPGVDPTTTGEPGAETDQPLGCFLSSEWRAFAGTPAAAAQVDDVCRDHRSEDLARVFLRGGALDQPDARALGLKAQATAQPGTAVTPGLYGYGGGFLSKSGRDGHPVGTPISDNTVHAVVQQLGGPPAKSRCRSQRGPLGNPSFRWGS